MRLALIDIGSNTIRLLICDVGSDGKIKRIKHRRIVTRLADGIVQTHRLNKKGRQATLKGVSSFLQTCNLLNVEKVYAIATNAVREAMDGQEFISEISSKVGIEVEIISGEQEADLTYEGIKGFIDESSTSVIVDIGGGSTELIYIEGMNILKRSIPMGVVKLKDMFLKKTPPDKDSIRQAQQYIIDLLKSNGIFDFKPQKLFITGGSATTLASIDMKLKRYNPDLVHLHNVSYDKVDELIERVSKMTLKEIIETLWVDIKRAEVIMAGLLLIKHLMNAFKVNLFVVSDYGLLEGLAFKKSMDI
ncbi:MAG: hypothetical protein N3A62_03640 [Thermodesulfovibrionales bacterium]|nr:hypothetical protein [Thermodesulfovibrionales bacterium]